MSVIESVRLETELYAHSRENQKYNADFLAATGWSDEANILTFDNPAEAVVVIDDFRNPLDVESTFVSHGEAVVWALRVDPQYIERVDWSTNGIPEVDNFPHGWSRNPQVDLWSRAMSQLQHAFRQTLALSDTKIIRGVNISGGVLRSVRSWSSVPQGWETYEEEQEMVLRELTAALATKGIPIVVGNGNHPNPFECEFDRENYNPHHLTPPEFNIYCWIDDPNVIRVNGLQAMHFSGGTFWKKKTNLLLSLATWGRTINADFYAPAVLDASEDSLVGTSFAVPRVTHAAARIASRLNGTGDVRTIKKQLLDASDAYPGVWFYYDYYSSGFDEEYKPVEKETAFPVVNANAVRRTLEEKQP